MSSDLKPHKALADLKPFVGNWKTEGTAFDEHGNEAGHMSATDLYEWLPGEFFLLHRVDGTLNGTELHVLEVIGADKTGRITDRFYDNRGMTGEQTYRLDGRHFEIDGAEQRFRGDFDDKFGTLRGLWEMTEDGKTWRPWMRIVLEKQAVAAARARKSTADHPAPETRH